MIAIIYSYIECIIYIIVRFIYLVTIKDVVVYVNSNNYCILAIYYLRTCNKLTKAYREVDMLCTIKTKQTVF